MKVHVVDPDVHLSSVPASPITETSNAHSPRDGSKSFQTLFRGGIVNYSSPFEAAPGELKALSSVIEIMYGATPSLLNTTLFD